MEFSGAREAARNGTAIGAAKSRSLSKLDETSSSWKLISATSANALHL
jgi:hypothetical protein